MKPLMTWSSRSWLCVAVLGLTGCAVTLQPDDISVRPVAPVDVIAYTAPVAPPPLPVYVQPPPPSPHHLWVPGHWAYGASGYYWVPGTWVNPPSPGYLWTPGYWAQSGVSFVFHKGYWSLHVGYYGGINYGHGYDGNGFHGGDWHEHQFVNRPIPHVTQVTDVTRVTDVTQVTKVTDVTNVTNVRNTTNNINNVNNVNNVRNVNNVNNTNNTNNVNNINNVNTHNTNNVNNINNVNNTTNQMNVKNIYHRPSFTGGPGGIAARPKTSEELAAESELHISATKEQVKHSEAAKNNPDLLYSSNKGKPKVAGTAKPAKFTGENVAEAKAEEDDHQPKEEPGRHP